ncbi:rhodanese-like domain-containing protein [Propionivibrio sp.]|uniref:rhodanese-like domain-containing protein n=1 Tax=Propionivibrio sp. TaxID=2212460 RepID=UPI0026236929|nr:rhodanese-like domain-containing protein [Propionivibrio sp.]
MIKHFFAFPLLCLAALAAHAEVINIDSAELARLAASGVAVVDIRTADEWQETGVIAGSRLLTFYDEKGQSNPPQWLEKVKAIARPDQPLILVCRSGKRSSAAAQFLSQQAGYKTVYNADKGLKAWAGEGRPVVQAATTATVVCAPGARC